MGAQVITEESFEKEVLKSNVPVLVDFWADWCGPCKAIAPIIDEIAAELTGKLNVRKLNVDDAQELAASYNIMSIPTLMIFKNGKAVEQIVGAMSKKQFLEKIKPHIG